MTDGFLTSKDVADRLQVTRRQIQKMVKAGKLPVVRHGRLLRFPVRAWESFMVGQEASAMASMQENSNASAS